MTQLRIVHLDSLAALRAAAEAWDDLWQRSTATLPSLRAELLAQWVEQFASADHFHAVAVEADGRLLAALPLVRRRVAGLIPAAAMPCNEWSASGDLLLDVEAADTVLEALAAAIAKKPWPLLWLDEALLDAPRWQRLQRLLADAGRTVATHVRWQVGRVAIDGDWAAYRARWSRKHRQKMAWAARHLAQRGPVRLLVHSQLAPGEVAGLMQQAFELEDRGWKGPAGSSVHRQGMAEFFVRQAEQAARWGQLELVFLHCGDRPVAFSFGLCAKGVFHSLKVGYDREFAEQTPGQLLRYYLLERFFNEPGRKAIDFLGPITEAHAAWLPEQYSVGRLAVALHGPRARLAVAAYDRIWPWLRALIRREKNS